NSAMNNLAKAGHALDTGKKRATRFEGGRDATVYRWSEKAKPPKLEPEVLQANIEKHKRGLIEALRASRSKHYFIGAVIVDIIEQTKTNLSYAIKIDNKRAEARGDVTHIRFTSDYLPDGTPRE